MIQQHPINNSIRQLHLTPRPVFFRLQEMMLSMLRLISRLWQASPSILKAMVLVYLCLHLILRVLVFTSPSEQPTSPLAVFPYMG